MSGPELHPFGYAHLEPSAGERLFRRCRRSHIDPRTGEIGYWLFKNGNDGMMSADAERCRSKEDERALAQATGWGLGALGARACVELGQVLVYWPEEDNPAHTQVVGDKPQRRQIQLAALATLLLDPPPG